MSGACPSEQELDRAIADGFDDALADHLAGCASCCAFVDATNELLALARDIPVRVTSPRSVEHQRTALLASLAVPVNTARRAPHRRRWLAAAAAALVSAAGIVLVVVVTSRKPAPPATALGHPQRGTVHPHAGAVFTRAAPAPDEIVRLRSGTIDVDVDPLHEGERFRVVAGIDTVEVRGTSFQVVAADDQLIAVHVVHGRVEVTHGTDPTVVLRNGDAWHVPETPIATSPISAGSATVVTSVRPRPLPPSHAPVAHTPAPVPDPTVAVAAAPHEVAFDEGWAAMRAHDYGPAVAAFARAIALAPNAALAEDSTFWRAVALARLQRSTEAVAALRTFLDGYPASSRAGNAAVMLGWLLFDAGDRVESRTLFERGAKDANADVRASADRGLGVTTPK